MNRPRLCRQHKKAPGAGIFSFSRSGAASAAPLLFSFGCARGCNYIVSSLGVTGVRSEIKTDLAAIMKVVRENTRIPCAIGFGISTPGQAKKMAHISDGAIVGSAIVKLLERYGKDAPPYIGEYVKQMKAAL